MVVGEAVAEWYKHDAVPHEFSIPCGEFTIPFVCELCWIGMVGSGDEYIWDGVNLLVFDKSDGEYHQRRGILYRPPHNVKIQFEYDKSSGKWQAMPR
jgi:hypothetical protein